MTNAGQRRPDPLSRWLLLLLLVAWPAVAADIDAGIRECWNADDPMAQLARDVRAKPEAFTFTDLAICVGQELYPGLKGDGAKRFNAELDALAVRLREPLEKATTPQAKAEAMAKVLYTDLEFRTATDEKPEQEQADNYFPHAVLKNKRGVCLGFSMVYLCLSERLKLPLVPAHAPQHIYVKWLDGEKSLSLETTARGRVYSEEDFQARFKLDDDERRKNGYFTPVGKLETLGDLLNGASWFSAVDTAERRLSPERALLMAQLCVAIEPRNFNNWDTLAQAYAYAGDRVAALAVLRKAIELKPPPTPQGDEYWKDRLERFEKAAGR